MNKSLKIMFNKRMLKVIYIWGNFRKCYNFLNKNDVMKKDESLNRNCEELIMRED